MAVATVEGYVEAISPERRPLFDHVRRLVLEACSDAEVVLYYGMPTASRIEPRNGGDDVSVS